MNRLVIIPALNPDDKIFEVIEKIKQLDFHVIVVNDGSDLSYLSLFNKLKNKCIVLSYEKNEGKGSAIKTALQWVKDEQKKYDVIGIMDADGQHLAEDMNHILEISYKNPSSLIIGNRYINRNVPWKSYFENKITSFFFFLIAGKK